MKNTKHKFAVVGVGVAGGILAAHLLKNDEDVVLVDVSKARLDEIKTKGLSVRDPKPFTHGHFTVAVKEACFSLSEAAKGGMDIVFVCVKACLLKSLLPEIKKVCQACEGARVVSFQNGLDTEELLAQAAGRRNVLRGVVNYAGRVPPDGGVEFTFFNKPNYIGALEDEAIPYAKDICGILNRAGLDTEYSHEIKRQVWEKSILNSMMSPVTALTRMTMKEVLDCEQTKEIVMELAREAIEVAGRSGIHLPDKFLDFCVSYLGKAGHHKPSMLVDVEAGCETEIDFLNGKICEYGIRNKVPVPYNRTISALIKGLERKQGEKND